MIINEHKKTEAGYARLSLFSYTRIILKALLRNAFKIILGFGLGAKPCKIDVGGALRRLH
ncbi:MAG: hypothetical protein AUK48_07515 [Oscillatoriales cyanobacterium CG2_30_44_21]|nr:MAG: hypothetical protein AUK48_07515 [Oscillatoriales cyanobacterium CG2_30_44_21]